MIGKINTTAGTCLCCVNIYHWRTNLDVIFSTELKKITRILRLGGGANHMGRASPVNWAVLPRSRLSSEVE